MGESCIHEDVLAASVITTEIKSSKLIKRKWESRWWDRHSMKYLVPIQTNDYKDSITPLMTLLVK